MLEIKGSIDAKVNILFEIELIWLIFYSGLIGDKIQNENFHHIVYFLYFEKKQIQKV